MLSSEVAKHASVKASDHSCLHNRLQGNDISRCPQGQLLQRMHIPNALEGLSHLIVQSSVHLILLPPAATCANSSSEQNLDMKM